MEALEMRPRSVVNFERIIFGTLALGLIQSYLAWDKTVAIAGATQSNPIAFVIGIQVASFALITTLTLLVSRRRSKIAMWISIAMLLLGLPMFFTFASKGLLFGSHLISTIQVVGQSIAFALLFTKSARLWMNRSEPHSDLRETFL
jgi:hypothetical protein